MHQYDECTVWSHLEAMDRSCSHIYKSNRDVMLPLSATAEVETMANQVFPLDEREKEWSVGQKYFTK